MYCLFPIPLTYERFISFMDCIKHALAMFLCIKEYILPQKFNNEVCCASTPKIVYKYHFLIQGQLGIISLYG